MESYKYYLRVWGSSRTKVTATPDNYIRMTKSKERTLIHLIIRTVQFGVWKGTKRTKIRIYIAIRMVYIFSVYLFCFFYKIVFKPKFILGRYGGSINGAAGRMGVNLVSFIKLIWGGMGGDIWGEKSIYIYSPKKPMDVNFVFFYFREVWGEKRKNLSTIYIYI